MGAATGGTDGLFSHDTRFLSQLAASDQRRAVPLLLGSNLRDDNAALVVDLTNPGYLRRSARRSCRRTRCMFCARSFFGATRFISGSACAITAIARSTCSWSILFANDFADLFEVRGTRREKRGTATIQLRGNDQVLLNYHGLDDKLRRTTLTFDPPPNRLATNGALYELRLEPGEFRPIFLAAGCNEGREPARAVPARAVKARRELREVERAAVPASKRRTSFSTRCCAARPPISRCS